MSKTYTFTSKNSSAVIIISAESETEAIDELKVLLETATTLEFRISDEGEEDE